jgi:divinyl chlorophyllide a 8-vinyl-reductase
LGKEPKFWTAPIGLFDVIIGAFEWLGQAFPSLKDAAELGRIGKYYAVEEMLTTDPQEKYGTITLQQHYERICVEGQDYDPYTTMLAKPKPKPSVKI